MPEVCVVHLLRRANGPDPVAAFVESYRRHRAGLDHELAIVFKGFESARELTEYERFLDGLGYRSLEVPDRGYDVEPYLQAASAFESSYFCFLNSFSVLLGDDWLATMYDAARGHGVGLVGATGSYESTYSAFVQLARAAKPAGLGLKAGLTRMAHAYRAQSEALRLRRHFPAFPNVHVRTNGFLIRREILLSVNAPSIRTKFDSTRFESGRTGLTRRVMALGLEPLVVGRDGRAYEEDRWFESRTFRSGGQANLLIADNRTRQYEQADSSTRRMLSHLAWGKADA